MIQFFCTIFIICVIAIYLIKTSEKLVSEYLHVNKNKSYIDVQNYFCMLAYDIIYKDQILAYSASGYKISGDALETSKRNFVKLVVELMGVSIYKYLSDFYGTSDSFNMNLIMWFTSKLDNDELIDYTTRLQKQTDTNDQTFETMFKSNNKPGVK